MKTRNRNEGGRGSTIYTKSGWVPAHRLLSSVTDLHGLTTSSIALFYVPQTPRSMAPTCRAGGLGSGELGNLLCETRSCCETKTWQLFPIGSNAPKEWPRYCGIPQNSSHVYIRCVNRKRLPRIACGSHRFRRPVPMLVEWAVRLSLWPDFCNSQPSSGNVMAPCQGFPSASRCFQAVLVPERAWIGLRMFR
jgi:hypothetical protein